MDKRFHPLGISICKNETAEEFALIFSVTKTGIEYELLIEYKAVGLVADAADAIKNGFKAVFGENISRIMCYECLPNTLDGIWG